MSNNNPLSSFSSLTFSEVCEWVNDTYVILLLSFIDQTCCGFFFLAFLRLLPCSRSVAMALMTVSPGVMELFCVVQPLVQLN